jgi:hypothetical protein
LAFCFISSAVTSDYIVATVILDHIVATVASDTIFEFVITVVALLTSRHHL